MNSKQITLFQKFKNEINRGHTYIIYFVMLCHVIVNSIQPNISIEQIICYGNSSGKYDDKMFGLLLIAAFIKSIRPTQEPNLIKT